jgi:hypothetical protein
MKLKGGLLITVTILGILMGALNLSRSDSENAAVKDEIVLIPISEIDKNLLDDLEQRLTKPLASTQ